MGTLLIKVPAYSILCYLSKKVPLNMKFKCKDCDLVTSKQKEFQEHIKKVHGKVGSFKCVKCGFVTKQKLELDDHVKNFHSKNESVTAAAEESNFVCFKCE